MSQGRYRVAQAKQRVHNPNQAHWVVFISALATAVAIAGMILVASAQVVRGETNAGVKIELNKLEQTDKGCRFYWLVNNQSEFDLKDLDVSFYWFQRDGVIGGDLRFAFAPAGPKTLKVKKYMLAEKTCADFSSLLVNEINQCIASNGPVAECAKHLSYASRTTVEFLK